MTKEDTLWEYEARLERSTTSGSPAVSAPMELFRPFGPLIARLEAPAAVVDALNRYVDTFVTQHGDPPGADGGPMTIGTFRLPGAAVAGPVIDFCDQAVRDYMRHCDGPPDGPVRFESFWVVRQPANTFSPVHFHSTDVAGVLYLKVPRAISEGHVPGNYITARRGGCITFLTGGRQALNKSYVSFTPQVGALLLAPAWLLHAVEPFDGPGERRSMAFNAFAR